MSIQEEQFNKRRVRSSYITSIVSMAMVLFMLGLFGLLLLNAKKLSDSTRESFTITVFFNDSATTELMEGFKAQMDTSYFCLASSITSKEEAAEIFQKQVGEDFVDFLGFNPLPASIDIRFKKEFAKEELFQQLEAQWNASPLVERVSYPRDLIRKINQNVKTLSYILLIFSAILLFIAITLINNTIRLAIYSRRFIIRTMQLVGATRAYIRRPFLWSSIGQGLLAGFIALTCLAGVIYAGEQQLPELRQLRDYNMLAILSGGIVLSGMFISWICTLFAVRKYLRLNTDSLY